jgi:hypothetical protein
MSDTEQKRVHLVVIGFPVEFPGGSVQEAEQYAASLFQKHGLARHMTVLTVDADWRNYTLVAENIGVHLTTPAEMTLPTDAEVDYDF